MNSGCKKYFVLLFEISELIVLFLLSVFRFMASEDLFGIFKRFFE